MLKDMARQLGQALRPVRPGLLALTTSKYSGFLGMALRVSSPAFGEGEPIPVRYTADGQGVFPPLRWEGVPARTASIVLLVEDADLPWIAPGVHLIVHSIPPELTELAEGAIPARLVGPAPEGYACGRNMLARPGWTPPTPPPGHGKHQYAFQVFALDAKPSFPYPPSRALLLRTMRPHLLAQGRLIGTYERA